MVPCASLMSVTVFWRRLVIETSCEIFVALGRMTSTFSALNRRSREQQYPLLG